MYSKIKRAVETASFLFSCLHQCSPSTASYCSLDQHVRGYYTKDDSLLVSGTGAFASFVSFLIFRDEVSYSSGCTGTLCVAKARLELLVLFPLRWWGFNRELLHWAWQGHYAIYFFEYVEMASAHSCVQVWPHQRDSGSVKPWLTPWDRVSHQSCSQRRGEDGINQTTTATNLWSGSQQDGRGASQAW